MLNVSDISVYTSEKDYDILSVEGEVVFENDHTTDFTIDIYLDDMHIENLEFDMDPGEINIQSFKECLLKSCQNIA